MEEEFMPPRLTEIVNDFAELEGSEKLEYLLEFAEMLPALPLRLQAHRDDMEEIHECLTPVFVFGELNEHGKMMFYFDAPPESPTVRGFASILIQGINDTATPHQIINIPQTFYLQTGLQNVLSGQRMRGMATFLNYMKQIAERNTRA